MTDAADLFADAPPDPRPGDEVAQVVVVCTANICRSPLVEAMLDVEARRRIGPDAPVWVRSSGIHGLQGEPAAEQSRVQAAARGLDLSHHRGAITDRDEVAAADLVVVMSRRHRAHVVRLHPPAGRWTFTLPELSRLLAVAEPVDDDRLTVRQRLRAAVVRASHARPVAPRDDAGDDIPDPYGGPAAGYVTMAERVERHVALVAPHLFGPIRGDSDHG